MAQTALKQCTTPPVRVTNKSPTTQAAGIPLRDALRKGTMVRGNSRVAKTVGALLLLSLTAGVQAQEWTNSWPKDEMTGERQSFAHSPKASPTKPMAPPYTGVTGRLSFGCDAQDEWAYLVFTEQPNLTNKKAQSGGYSTFTTRVRWDDNVTTMGFLQEWGTRYIHFQSDSTAIANIQSAKEVLVELNWYRSGKVYFKFSLDGSADAITSARKACRGYGSSQEGGSESGNTNVDRNSDSGNMNFDPNSLLGGGYACELANGYMKATADAPAGAKEQVTIINAKRKEEYKKVAAEHGVTAKRVAKLVAKKMSHKCQ